MEFINCCLLKKIPYSFIICEFFPLVNLKKKLGKQPAVLADFNVTRAIGRDSEKFGLVACGCVEKLSTGEPHTPAPLENS